MIISASRRTDLPAFYAPWFMNRIRAGVCRVPNPYNPAQSTEVSLRPGDVDAIVFWTRNPRPLLPHLRELDARGYRYYFHVTLMDNPRGLDPRTPPPARALAAFGELAGRIGPERVLWRYDPIVLGSATPAAFHADAFERLAAALEGLTRRCTISLVERYRKTARRMREAAAAGFEAEPPAEPALAELLTALRASAERHRMDLRACTPSPAFEALGIGRGKCVDDELIRRVFGARVAAGKDPSQRPRCGCVVSRDIGAYDTCLYGCRYCYATSSLTRAAARHRAHDPRGDALVAAAGPPAASPT